MNRPTVARFADALDPIGPALRADKLSAAGVPVFPCKPSKAPRVRGGFRRAQTGGREFWSDRSWWRGDRQVDAVGAVPAGAGLCVVDLDVKGGLDGLTAFEMVTGISVAEHPHKCQTPSGGWHLWFSADFSVPVQNGWRPGVDIRGEGGYVLVHAGGSGLETPRYVWYVEEETDWQPVPPEIGTGASPVVVKEAANRRKALARMKELTVAGEDINTPVIIANRVHRNEHRLIRGPGERNTTAHKVVSGVVYDAEEMDLDLRRILKLVRKLFLHSEPTAAREAEWTNICTWVLSQERKE